MILFMIKKAFFDMWDNLFSVALVNIGFTLLIGLNLSILHVLWNVHYVVFIFGTGIAIVLTGLYIGAASMIAGDIADYHSPTFKGFFQYLKEIWKSTLVFCFLSVFLVVIFTIIIPWYAGMGGLFGIAAMGLLFWFGIIWLFASQYYFPVRSRLDKDVKKIVKKCIVLFFDNTAFTLVLGIGTLILLLLSSLTAFLLPGLASLLIWHQVGLKLRLYKYEYFEQQSVTHRKRIPWNTLLVDDREKVGKRTLRSMIFPWKE